MHCIYIYTYIQIYTCPGKCGSNPFKPHISASHADFSWFVVNSLLKTELLVGARKCQVQCTQNVKCNATQKYRQVLSYHFNGRHCLIPSQ